MPTPSGAGRVSLPRDWSSMRELRRGRGFSQTRLAELSGVSERTVRAIEAGTVGRPQHESLRRIAAVLAYGESHQTRLVERWTGASSERSPGDVGVPDSERLHERVRARRPSDGGRLSSLMCQVTIGPDRAPLRAHYLQVHEAMNASGNPVLWKLTRWPTFASSSVRFEVLTGGVVDDLYVEGDVTAWAIRPDPAIAQRGPFLMEYSIDFTRAERVSSLLESEWMYGATTPLQLATMVVRFTGQFPQALWSVRGATVTGAERGQPLHATPEGSVQVCHQDLVGVFGIQWEWGDETR